jgi:hypothetical protein
MSALAWWQQLKPGSKLRTVSRHGTVVQTLSFGSYCTVDGGDRWVWGIICETRHLLTQSQPFQSQKSNYFPSYS